MFAHLGYVIWTGLRASQGKMQDIPFEDFIPRWSPAQTDEGEDDESRVKHLRERTMAAFGPLMAGAKAAGKQGSQLRPRERRG